MINIVLNGQDCTVDTSTFKWSTKMLDKYTIVDLVGVKCFVKRFEHEPNAMAFLQNLKGQSVVNIPQIYDFVSTTENNKTVYYLFTEVLEGKTLKEAIAANENIDLAKMLTDLMKSLFFLHENGIWFSDFNDENIFYVPDGEQTKYFLIDIDSCWENDITPTTQGRGSMPQKTGNYNLTIYKYYTEKLGNTDFDFSKIKGKNLNYLQLISLLAHLQFFKQRRLENTNTNYFDFPMYKNLHEFIYEKVEERARGVFDLAMEDRLNQLSIIERFGRELVVEPKKTEGITIIEVKEPKPVGNKGTEIEIHKSGIVEIGGTMDKEKGGKKDGKLSFSWLKWVAALLVLPLFGYQGFLYYNYNSLLEDAKNAESEGRFSVAIDLYADAKATKSFLNADYDFGDAYNRCQGNLLLDEGDELFAKGVVLDSTQVVADSTATIDTTSSKEVKFAQAIYKRAYSIYPSEEAKNKVTLCEKVETARDLRVNGSYKEAIEKYLDAVQFGKSIGIHSVDSVLIERVAYCYYELGNAVFNQKNYAASIPHYKEVINYATQAHKEQNYVDTYWNLGYAYIETRQYPEAIKSYSTYIEKVDSKTSDKTRIASAYVNKGVAYARQNDMRQACYNYCQALSYDSSNETAMRNKQITPNCNCD